MRSWVDSALPIRRETRVLESVGSEQRSTGLESRFDEAAARGSCFTFGDPFNRRYRRADLELPPTLDPWSVLDGSATSEMSISASWQTAGETDDVIWTTEAVLALVSSRFVRSLQEQHLTGWRVHPVAFTERDAIASAYQVLVVTGRSHAIQYCRPPGARETEDWHIRVDPLGWNGSDFFLAEGTAFIFASNRVHQLVTTRGVKNVEMTGIDDVRIADVVVQRLTRAK